MNLQRIMFRYWKFRTKAARRSSQTHHMAIVIGTPMLPPPDTVMLGIDTDVSAGAAPKKPSTFRLCLQEKLIYP